MCGDRVEEISEGISAQEKLLIGREAQMIFESPRPNSAGISRIVDGIVGGGILS